METKQSFSLRKLSVGLASVLIGISFLNGTKANVVKADTITASTKTGEISKAGNLEVTGNSKDLSAFSMSFNGKNGENETAKADTTSDQTTQTGDQAETKNQENKLVDQINYKLTNNTSTDHKEDLGQNLTAPDETKSTSTTKSDAEKSLVSPSSAQKINNQSNDHAEDNSQSQLDITKNSQQLNKKVLATNLTQDNSTQKDYTPDINAWTGHDDGTYYILDKYTPQNDAEKDLIVIPNAADFEKAGKNINGHEVGITRDVTLNFMSTINPKEVHFSETDGKKIKAIGCDWHSAFRRADNTNPFSNSRLEAMTGNSLDTSSIVNMNWMFYSDKQLTNISALSTWDVSNTVLASAFFQDTDISDLTPFVNWNTRSLEYIGHGFSWLPHLTSIEPLRHWNMKNARFTDNMFTQDPELIDIDAINDWDYSNEVATGGGWGNYPLDDMFYGDHKIKINIDTDSRLADFIRRTGRLDAFHNSSNQITTNNTKLIKLLTNDDLQDETSIAKRTITFTGLPANRAIPPIVQTINYTKLATAVIDMTGTSDSNAHGKIVSSGFEKDWKLDTSKQNDDVIIDGVINFKSVKIPHINGYKAHLIKDPINPAMFLVSFMALPQQNKQSNNIKSSQKPVQIVQKQLEPVQTRPADDKQVDQIINHISSALMYNISTSDTADNFEPVQNDSASLENISDSTQKDDAAKPQKVNAAKPKKHIAKKHVVKRHKKHAKKKYHLKRRSRKHTKRAKKRIIKHRKRAKKRIIKHRKSVSRKFRKYNLKHIKKS